MLITAKPIGSFSLRTRIQGPVFRESNVVPAA
jgi:hypothetical protein